HQRATGSAWNLADRNPSFRSEGYLVGNSSRQPRARAVVSTSLLWNEGERIEIVDGDWPHPGTQACGNVERVQPPKVRVVDPAAPFQPVHHIIARVEVRRFYQVSKKRWAD